MPHNQRPALTQRAAPDRHGDERRIRNSFGTKTSPADLFTVETPTPQLPRTSGTQVRSRTANPSPKPWRQAEERIPPPMHETPATKPALLQAAVYCWATKPIRTGGHQCTAISQMRLTMRCAALAPWRRWCWSWAFWVPQRATPWRCSCPHNAASPLPRLR